MAGGSLLLLFPVPPGSVPSCEAYFDLLGFCAADALFGDLLLLFVLLEAVLCSLLLTKLLLFLSLADRNLDDGEVFILLLLLLVGVLFDFCMNSTLFLMWFFG